jgi:hypothetical protein
MAHPQAVTSTRNGVLGVRRFVDYSFVNWSGRTYASASIGLTAGCARAAGDAVPVPVDVAMMKETPCGNFAAARLALDRLERL